MLKKNTTNKFQGAEKMESKIKWHLLCRKNAKNKKPLWSACCCWCTDAVCNIDLLRTLTVVSEVIWKLVGITYSIVKHLPFSSPGTDRRESCEIQASKQKCVFDPRWALVLRGPVNIVGITNNSSSAIYSVLLWPGKAAAVWWLLDSNPDG